ncbi:hypothetical protein AC792_08670 [Arthrobacter sp. RIT-PI-e]|uniref:hypothetical protein n=1 Tax=Arthrobacter sp. RIT-PI-e TaxID=1681197 RepID=UPI0006A00B96|nr:hypothetical protein [Arthrobacter sp. RIT-PI-e]KNC19038.1 hypothetical protein AC792_08670 [Arthrobacter sp. RIT-PI-e]
MTEDTSLQEVAAAQTRLEQARTDLHEAVIEARTQHTWAEIGAVLGMTRQAAFKRFGSPRDPRTGDTMHPAQTTTDLLDTTEKVFRLIDAGDYDALAPMMTKDTAAVLTRELVLGTWAQAVADTGNLVDCRDTRLELPDGTPIDISEAVHGTLIGHTTINCEAGHWVGRVAYNTDRNITGVLIVPPNHGQLPF